MVANNIGRAETGIVAGNFMGILHSVVTNHKFNQIFSRRMNNTTNFRPENSPHRTNKTGIVAGNFMGILHSVVTNHKFNQIFSRRMNNTTNFRPENSPHRTNFRSKFQVAFAPSRNLSPKVRAVQNNTCLKNSRKCR